LVHDGEAVMVIRELIKKYPRNSGYVNVMGVDLSSE
jgi:hypothetical protein